MVEARVLKGLTQPYSLHWSDPRVSSPRCYFSTQSDSVPTHTPTLRQQVSFNFPAIAIQSTANMASHTASQRYLSSRGGSYDVLDPLSP